ncbi:MAG: DUF72 domain-containing protein [Saprospiraceae bacterium]
MKFGRLSDLSAVDFSLPPDALATERVLAALPQRKTPPELYVGCTGWSMKEWIGHVYPRGTKTTEFLYHYTRQFNTIELNTTHYRIPTMETVVKWREQTADGFKFCPKIPQSISHSKDLGLNGDLTTMFCENIAFLEDKLGCCFMQLPPYFGVDRLPILQQFLLQFPDYIPLAVEVRHESWFENQSASEQLFTLLEEHSIASVITDVPGRRDVLHNRLTTGTAMLRWNGNGLIDSDYQRMDAWLERIQSWFNLNLQTVYIFTHEPDNILAPDMADYTVQKAKELFQSNIRGPEFYDRDRGEQMSLF